MTPAMKILARLLEKLVEAPCNILFTTITGAERTRTELTNPDFRLECLVRMDRGCYLQTMLLDLVSSQRAVRIPVEAI